MKKLALLAMLIVFAVAVAAQTQTTPQTKGTSGSAASDEAAVLEVENSWPDAVMKKDIPTLERYYADEVTDVGPDGSLSTKQKDIDDIRNGVFVVQSATAIDLKPRIYGNTAVVTGVGQIRGTYQNQDISGRYRFTDTLVKRNGEWRVVASQVTKIVEQPQ